MAQSFTMTSDHGRREVHAYHDAYNGYWRLTLTKRTKQRSETRDGRSKTKGEAVARAKEWIAVDARKPRT